jgi:AcrR family transcriptional regulator
MNETTRERLIRIARQVFADKGYEAASVREITAAASANLGAITYHFGSKQALYEAVLDSVMEPLAARLGIGGGRGGSVVEEGSEARAAGEGTPLERIDAMVAALFDHLAANPDLQLLVLQQAVTRQAMPDPLRRRFGLLLERLANEIRAGQREGSIRAGDALLTALSLLAQPMYFGLVGRLAPDRLKGESGARPSAAMISSHARRFIHAGLAAGTEGENG